ncbi:hypothetical protein [Pandoraea bronchicola]|uniref:hypothetical protein n=1 Tax=Pandoraea bronchicola TaxID=2508287 RepID=UPI001582CA69|nr:hypothetical protein [Pandoraea bronchicola]
MEQNEVIRSVDTHLNTHVGAVIGDTGRLLGTLSVSTGRAGYLDLLTWANSFGSLRIEVLEVNRPGLQSTPYGPLPWFGCAAIRTPAPMSSAGRRKACPARKSTTA